MAACAEAGEGGLPLDEFVKCYELPKWATVKTVSGLSARYQAPRFKSGDVLLLRMLAVENVKLSFYDVDAGSNREVRVPPSSKVKFNIVTSNAAKSKNRYETISELLEVCPTFFQSNITYDDPYLPAILRPGEKFKFIRRVRSKDGNVCLECENEDGNILQLPKSCKGDFSLVEDNNSYTLKELVELSPVPRKLRFANENTKLHQRRREPSELELIDNDEDGQESHIYGNVKYYGGNDILQRITGLPLNYKGTFEMSKPELYLVASPCENLDDKWQLSIGLDIRLEEHVVPENHLWQYDRLPVKIYTLEKFLEQFECDLPVSAKIVNYDHMPHEFQDYLVDSMDIIIHRIDRNDSVLATTRGKYHIIKENFRGKFRKAVRKYTSLKELKNLNEKNVTVKIMQDVASDFPHFSLQMGDILRFQSLESQRFGHRTYGECKVIKCERFLENGKYEKIKLPEELEVFMFEVPTGERSAVFTSLDLLHRQPNLPFSVDHLSNEWEREHILPVDQEISLNYFVGDPVAVISPLPPKMKSRTGSAINSKVEYCLQIPHRHEMTLTLKGKLEFPPEYFQMPTQLFWKSLPVEHLTQGEYDKLVNHEEQAYESYGVPIVSESASEKRRNSSFFAARRRQKKKCRSESDISKMATSKTAQKGSDDEENIYETYNFRKRINFGNDPLKQDQKPGEKRSIFKMFSKRQ